MLKAKGDEDWHEVTLIIINGEASQTVPASNSSLPLLPTYSTRVVGSN